MAPKGPYKYEGMSAQEQKAAYYQAKKANRRAFLAELKDKPCMDCGGRFPAVCMDFHHRNGDGKKFSFGTRSKALVLEEIKKCDLICANCHRLRHHP